MRLTEQHAPTHRADPAAAMLALARAEARRLGRHPLMLAGFAVGVFVAVVAWRGGTSDLETHGSLAGQIVLPLATATLIACQLVSARAARDSVEGSDDALPLSPARRTAALLIAGLVAPVMALAIMAPFWAFMLGPDLARTVDGGRWHADVFDLAQPLVLILAMAWLGVGLGRLNTWTPGAVVVALILTWSPLVWVNPMIAIDAATGDPYRDTLASIPWQVGFLAGLAFVGATLALTTQRVRGMRVALPAAVAVTTLAGIVRF